MAVLARLVVPIGGNSSGLARELAKSHRMAEAWSKTVGASVDRAFSGLAAKAAPLRKLGDALSAVSKGTGLARVALSAGDAYRAFGRLGVGADRLRLAFTFNAARAADLREKIGRTTAGLDAMRAMSLRARVALFKIDLAAFGAKLAIVVAKLNYDLFMGLGRATMGLTQFGTGAVRAVASIVGIVPNAARAAGSLVKAGAAAAGSARRTVELASAWFHARKSLMGVAELAGGLRGLAGGTLRAARGLTQVGVGVSRIGWNIAVTGSLGLARGLAAVGSAAGAAVLRLGGVVGIAGVLAASMGVKAAAGAAHLEETYNKVRQTFGEFAGGVLSESKKLNVAFGVQEQGFLDGASAIGAMLKGMGYAQADAAKLGTNLAKLAADSKAFRDVSLDTALQKIRSGLSGEAEPLKEFGILIDEDTVKAYAYAKGIAKMGAELTNAQKVQSRMGLITKGLADDQGALAREATGTAAQISEFWGRLETLANTVGASLAPALGELLQGVNVGIATLSRAWTENTAAIAAWFGVSMESFAGAGGGVGLVTEAVVKMAETWGWVSAKIYEASSTFKSWQASVTSWFSSFYSMSAKFAEAIGQKDAAGVMRLAADEAKLAADKLAAASGQFADEAAKKLAEIPKVGGAIRAELAKTKFEIDKLRADAAAPLDLKPEADPKDLYPSTNKGKKAHAFAEAMDFGSKESAAAILRSKFGGGGKTAEKTEANTKQTATAAKATVDVLRQLDGKLADLVGRAGLAASEFIM